MRKMFTILLAALAITGFANCKKAVQQAQEQVVVNAITDGVWIITNFTEAGTDITASFAGWEFIFYANGTSLGTKTGAANVTGTWTGDSGTFSFTTKFTSAAPEPLPKAEGTWTVTFVGSASKGRYTRTTNGITYNMEMTKK
jgi:hypothetical protein